MITQISVVYATIPFIILERDEIITESGQATNEIDFNELGAYIRMLTQQQEALGKYVNFSKGTYTINNKQFDAIVIEASDLPPDPENPTEYTITYTDLDGETVVITDTFANIKNNNEGLPPTSLIVPFAFYSELPVLNIDGKRSFASDYGHEGMGGAMIVEAEYDGVSKYLVYTARTNDQPANINFTQPLREDLIKITNEVGIEAVREYIATGWGTNANWINAMITPNSPTTNYTKRVGVGVVLNISRVFGTANAELVVDELDITDSVIATHSIIVGGMDISFVPNVNTRTVKITTFAP